MTAYSFTIMVAFLYSSTVSKLGADMEAISTNFKWDNDLASLGHEL
jgi:hypothetical protein